MRTEIEFQSLDVVLDIPPSIKCFKSAIRAIWFGYDHFSDYCPSFQIPQYKNLYKDLGNEKHNLKIGIMDNLIDFLRYKYGCKTGMEKKKSLA